MRYPKTLFIFFLVSLLGGYLAAQKTSWFQWTLLPQEQMDEIIGEASGETAFHHILEMAGYNRDRQAREYEGTFIEASYMLEQLKKYRIPQARIIRYPGGRTWDGVKGELWEVDPIRQKLASYTDIRAMLASGSRPADVTAELVWIGEGDQADFTNRDLQEKIVVTSNSPSRVHSSACLQKGAAGIISFYSPRPLIDPLLIPWSGIRGGKDIKFAFYLPPREGHLLRDRLKRGEKITVHAVVDSTMRDYEIQDVTAAIPGTEANGPEIIFTAHLFEGYTKQGANDNISGSAAILEMARVLNLLIENGRLPRPRRTIRFLWVPEFSGTIPWVNDNLERMKRTLCNINLDMVGLKLAESRTFMTFMRTTYGNPHYLNDVMENYYRYIGETNRTYVTNGMDQRFSRRIVAPSGTEDPFYYYVGTHMGASDHEVFNDWAIGVPGIVMNTWPDRWYHTSEDRPDKIDPTQLKRCVILGAAAAYTIAAADDGMAVRLAAEIVGNASARLAHQMQRGAEEIRRADSRSLEAAYKKARGYVEAAAINELATLDTVSELAVQGKIVNAALDAYRDSVTQIKNSHLKTLQTQMKAAAEAMAIPPTGLEKTELEKKAEALVPRPTEIISARGYRGYRTLIEEASRTKGKEIPGRLFRSAGEIQRLCTGKNSALDIKKMLDTQFQQETDLSALLEYLELLQAAGLIKLN